eukprot:m.101563 g.101563  ORF g.101563 m.101563 type:complete len:92 (-) comp20764_c0_seq1:250-525(-)
MGRCADLHSRTAITAAAASTTAPSDNVHALGMNIESSTDNTTVCGSPVVDAILLEVCLRDVHVAQSLTNVESLHGTNAIGPTRPCPTLPAA